MLIRTARGGHGELVTLGGELTLPDVPMLATLSESLTAPGPRAVVCDLAELQVPLTRSLLTVFPAALRRAGGWPHCTLHLAVPGPALWSTLQQMRMHRYLPLHPDVATATDAARRDVVTTWPAVTLPASNEGVLAARTVVADLWPDGAAPPDGAGGGRRQALAVVDALSSNVVRHVAAPFTLTVGVSPRRVLIAVGDGSPRRPVLRPAHPSAARHGRGLRLVADLAQEWGFRLVHRGGKTVWAALDPPAVTTRAC